VNSSMKQFLHIHMGHFVAGILGVSDNKADSHPR
jgi:hypothetical protein